MTIPRFTRRTSQLPQYGEDEIDQFILMLADMKTIYTFEQLGAMLGIAHQSIARWLWGKAKPHKMSIKFCLDNYDRFCAKELKPKPEMEINESPSLIKTAESETPINMRRSSQAESPYPHKDREMAKRYQWSYEI